MNSVERTFLEAVCITIDRDSHVRVELPDSDDYQECCVYEGRNTLSSCRDVFVFVPGDDEGYAVYRYSGKEEKWHCFRENTDNDPWDELRYYNKVENVSSVSPEFYEDKDEDEDEYEGEGEGEDEDEDEDEDEAIDVGIAPGKPRTPKKGELFMSLKKVFGRFGKAEKGTFAIAMDGQVAIRRKDSTYACLQGDNLVNMDTFALDIDAFYYMPVEPNQLAVNDVVVVGSGVGFVMGLEEGGGIRVYDVNAECIKVIKPSVHFLMKTPFVTKVVSLINMTGDGNGGDSTGLNPLMFLMMGEDIDPLMMIFMMGQGGMGNIDPMLLFMLLGNKKKGDKKDLLPLLMMSGVMGGASGAGGAGGMNPMLMAMAMGGDGGMDDILPFLLMSQGGGLFGTAPTPTESDKPAG